MINTENWEMSKKRYEAWWEGEMLDRVLFKVECPKNKADIKQIPQPAGLEEKWTNIDYIIESNRNRIKSTFFGGDANPDIWPNLGPDILGAICGCEMAFSETTTWAKPFVKSWEDQQIKFDPNNIWLKRIEAMTKAIAEDAKGDYIVGMTDLHQSLDCLSAMRGPENLCIDLIECPEIVKKRLIEVNEVFKIVYQRLYDIILRYQPEGVPDPWRVWYSRGKYLTNSCDFIYMISPEMFNEFALPIFVDELNSFDATMFHLDGNAALNHLDAILDLPALKCVSFNCSHPQIFSNYIHIFKKIQKAGKRVHVYSSPEEVELILPQLDPKGVLYETCCKSEEEAADLLKLAEKLSYRKKFY